MKRLLIYSILLLFLFNSMGYYFLFEFHKYMTRAEMQYMIERADAKITILSIVDVEHDQEFHRIDKKEFRYHGVMYDIKREIKTGRTTVFICVHDVKESTLFAGLKRVDQNKLNYAMWDHVNMIFLSQPTIDLSTSCTGKLVFPLVRILLNSTLLPTWSPPPELS
ncbi:MAG: hypothetical protein WCK09_17810 [Bacteroidota bacterium]